jgi:hypothetical protein
MQMSNRIWKTSVVLGAFGFVLFAAAPAEAQTRKMQKNRAAITGVTGGAAVTGGKFATATELTSQECTGLGGKVSETPAGDPKCSTKEVCLTTDKHGVIRMACIDEVAAD